MTGTPGTGKTTIAKLVAEKLGAAYVELSAYAEEHGFVIEEDAERDTRIVDMGALRKALEELSPNIEKPLIIDGHYGHELLEPGIVSLVVVLRKAPWELQEILQNRLYSYEKVWENLDAEIMGVIAGEAGEMHPLEKLHEIDTTGRTPEETALEIIDVLNGETRASFGPIDWIAYPETLRVLVNRTCTL